jgi:CRISPR system Cascade subunit CasA
MPLNLLADPWIPVLREHGKDTIRPDQIAEAGVIALNWPRPDLNLACMEMLIGLVYLADPPQDTTDWRARKPDAGALRAALAPLASAFNLTGDGPLFLQDLERLQGEPNAPDMLFIDSAGASTAGKNADLMVKRDHYPSLDLPLAAMALYTLQAHAPSGGAGNRTSMRGGGPMVTLVRPAESGACPLWSLIWANVPEGVALGPDQLGKLPWMRATRTSEAGAVVEQPQSDHTPPEVFFGMPRRLRLVEADGQITGVIQKPWGTNYGLWRHPLTPYYALKEGADRLPKHPKPGTFAYRNWLGILMEAPAGKGSLAYRAQAVADYSLRAKPPNASVLVAGWAMSNMSPLDFIWSEQPLFTLTPEAGDAAAMLVAGADLASRAMVMALRDVQAMDVTEGTRLDPEREAFYLATQAGFVSAISALTRGEAADGIGRDWLVTLRRQALKQFDAKALNGLAERDVTPRDNPGFSRRPTAQRIIATRGQLLGNLHGPKIHEALGLTPPESAKRKVKA